MDEDMNNVPVPAGDGAEPVKKPSKKKKALSPAEAAAALSFEAAAARLEEVVRSLESDSLPLDQSLSLYEEGIALVRRCSSELNDAEQKVKVLRRTAEGDVRPGDFGPADPGE